jgi:hypothetical protein
LFTVIKSGVKDREQRPQVDLVHVPKVFRAPIAGFHYLLRQKPPYRDIIRVEFNLNSLPNKAVQISEFRGVDGRIVGLNAVSVDESVFSYGRLVRML